MQINSIMKIKTDINLYNYLRENSYWYKKLNRDPASILLLESEMKEKYKLTATDKIGKISNNINMVRTFMDMLK